MQTFPITQVTRIKLAPGWVPFAVYNGDMYAYKVIE